MVMTFDYLSSTSNAPILHHTSWLDQIGSWYLPTPTTSFADCRRIFNRFTRCRATAVRTTCTLMFGHGGTWLLWNARAVPIACRRACMLITGHGSVRRRRFYVQTFSVYNDGFSLGAAGTFSNCDRSRGTRWSAMKADDFALSQRDCEHGCHCHIAAQNPSIFQNPTREFSKPVKLSKLRKLWRYVFIARTHIFQTCSSEITTAKTEPNFRTSFRNMPNDKPGDDVSYMARQLRGWWW